MDVNGQQTDREENTEYLSVTDLFQHGSKVIHPSIWRKIGTS